MFSGGRFAGDGKWEAAGMHHFAEVYNTTYHWTDDGANPVFQNEQGSFYDLASNHRSLKFDPAHPNRFRTLSANYNFVCLPPEFRLWQPVGWRNSPSDRDSLVTFHILQEADPKDLWVVGHKCWHPQVFKAEVDQNAHCKMNYKFASDQTEIKAASYDQELPCAQFDD
jgi:hypothetical protein